MEQLVGACGIVCSECEAYKATQANDADAIAKVVADWNKQFNADLKPEYIYCDGCMVESSRKCGHCAECDIRACVTGRGIANCAHCNDYGCETITNLFQMFPLAKQSLDEIRAGLGK
jgi:hypothetical protein